MENQIFSSISIDELRTVISETVIDEVRKLLLPTQQPQQTELISRKETAKILGISLVSLASWQNSGLIPAYRINTRVRFKRDEVMSCLTAIQTKSFKGAA